MFLQRATFVDYVSPFQLAPDKQRGAQLFVSSYSPAKQRVAQLFLKCPKWHFHVNLASLLAFFPGQWGTDVQVHDYFVTADFQTDDPKEAARGRGLP